MNSLLEWATRWGVPPAAIQELGMMDASPVDADEPPMSEAFIQSRIRLCAAKRGWHLYRNNVGAGKLSNGAFVRWGLCNDSSGLNDRVKSADLVGWRPVLITADKVGQWVAQFVSIECKASDWRFKGDTHEEAQLAWKAIVAADGGLALITNDPQALG